MDLVDQGQANGEGMPDRSTIHELSIRTTSIDSLFFVNLRILHGERILKVTKKSGNRERCRKLSL